MDSEIADLVDENDRVIGRATRAEIRAKNLLHRGVFVVCRDPTGRVYVHRRTDDRDTYPGTYDVTVGGLVTAGETYEDAARRELAEELGIDPPLRFVDHFLFESPGLRFFTAVYETTCDGSVTPDPAEISWGEFLSVEEIEARLTQWPFATGVQEFFDRYMRDAASRTATELRPLRPESRPAHPTASGASGVSAARDAPGGGA